MSGMFGTALNPSTLIAKQWIAKEYLASDLFFIGRRDEDFVGGYKPHIMQMEALVEIIRDGLEFSITDLTDIQGPLGAAGQILQVDPTGEFMEFVDPIDDFIDLLDTPTDYTGFAGYSVVVNQTEDGLEFLAPPPAEEVRYEARLTFNGTNDPLESILHINSLPVTITWTRTGVGIYLATFSANVDDTKLVAYINNTSTGAFHIGAHTNTSILFIHDDTDSNNADCDGDISVEIKLYP